jgi:F-type H+-transporting ATPase subunit d
MYSSSSYSLSGQCAFPDTRVPCCRASGPCPTFSEKPATPTNISVQRSAASKIDWANLGTKLGLRGTTAQALQTFKKRNDDARRKVQILSEQPQKVDFAHYRSVLKNTAIVDDIEKQFNAFQVKKYDVNRQIKAIEAYEAQAVKSAEETKTKVDAELKDLEKTLKNIETARPFEDLTVVRLNRTCVAMRCYRRRESHVMTVSDNMCRTRSLLPAPTSTSASSSSSPRAAGTFPATR